jgi:hypothetical protein
MATKTTTAQIEHTLDELSDDLEAVATEIELKLKLASMDVRDKWRTAFEPKLFEARMHAREAKEHSKKAVADAVQALRDFSAAL